MSTYNKTYNKCALNIRGSGTNRYNQYPAGLEFLWNARNSSGRMSAVGPDPTWSYAGAQYDDDGNSIGTVPAVHEGKGVWCGPAYTNMLQNSKFEGAVSGTPGTGPTNWTAAYSSGTITYDSSAKTLRVATTVAARHLFGQTISVAANTVYRFCVATNIIVPAVVSHFVYPVSPPTGATFTFEVDGTEQLASYMLPAGAHELCVKLSVGATAGTCLFRLGVGCAGTVIADAVFSRPQITTTYRYPYVASGAGATASVASAAGTSGGNGMAFALSSRMLAALGMGGRFTAAALCYMGASSTANKKIQLLQHGDTAFGLIYNDISNVIVKTYDNTNNFAQASSVWDRGEIHLLASQTNAAGTQYRAGYRRYTSSMTPITEMTWGTWIAYDGSMNPLTHLRLAYGSSVPIWISQVQLWSKSATDAEILRMMELGIMPPAAPELYYTLDSDGYYVTDSDGAEVYEDA